MHWHDTYSIGDIPTCVVLLGLTKSIARARASALGLRLAPWLTPLLHVRLQSTPAPTSCCRRLLHSTHDDRHEQDWHDLTRLGLYRQMRMWALTAQLPPPTPTAEALGLRKAMQGHAHSVYYEHSTRGHRTLSERRARLLPPPALPPSPWRRRCASARGRCDRPGMQALMAAPARSLGREASEAVRLRERPRAAPSSSGTAPSGLGTAADIQSSPRRPAPSLCAPRRAPPRAAYALARAASRAAS